MAIHTFALNYGDCVLIQKKDPHYLVIQSLGAVEDQALLPHSL